MEATQRRCLKNALARCAHTWASRENGRTEGRKKRQTVVFVVADANVSNFSARHRVKCVLHENRMPSAECLDPLRPSNPIYIHTYARARALTGQKNSTVTDKMKKIKPDRPTATVQHSCFLDSEWCFFFLFILFWAVRLFRSFCISLISFLRSPSLHAYSTHFGIPRVSSIFCVFRFFPLFFFFVVLAVHFVRAKRSMSVASVLLCIVC